MFANCSTSQQRLTVWRDLRNSFTADDNIEDVIKSFSDIKVEPRYIDYYTPESWPNVFEIVSEGHICQSGLTLIIASTLKHLDFIKTDKVQLEIVSNHITGAEGLVLRYNDNYYNFLPGQICNSEYVQENGVIYGSHIITVDKFFS